VIITRTPFRVSFFGGGTDYPAWFREHGGAVLSTAIDKYCYISCRFLPPFFDHRHRIVYSKIENVHDIAEIEHPAVKAVLGWMGWERGLEIHHDGDLPARSGLGSSSSFTVGLIHALSALQGRYLSHDELARHAIHVEQDLISENVGSQDQVSAAFGGFNRVTFRPDGAFDVVPVILPSFRRQELHGHLMLCFTGFSRFASEVAKSTIANFDARRAQLARMAQMVDEAIRILREPAQPIAEFGRLLHESWQHKRSLSDRVSTGDIDAIYEAARSAGALGGKLMGAGGGGFMLLFAPPDAQARIRARLSKLVHVPFEFEPSGSRVVLYQPDGL
jgi:D-glycero-alpha-D-manno-heptose-7-phosphate kinase